jgi:hypothetical protein
MEEIEKDRLSGHPETSAGQVKPGNQHLVLWGIDLKPLSHSWVSDNWGPKNM